jgi:AI-2 transport protein TqsA
VPPSPATTPGITEAAALPDSRGGRSGIPRVLIILLGGAGAVIVLAGMRAAAWLIAPVFLALVIVIALSPVQQWLLRRGWPSWLSTPLLLVLIYALLCALMLTMIVSIGQLATLLPGYASSAQELVAQLTGVLRRLGLGQGQARSATGPVSFSNVLGLVGRLVSGLSNLVTSFAFLLALLLFLGVEARGAGARISAIAAERPEVAGALRSFARGTRKYLVVTTVFGLIVAVLDTIALALLGIPLVLLWGLPSFITNYIPNIGFFLGLVPPALLGLLAGGWQLMLAVIVIYCLLNFVVQSLVQPRFVGDSVGLSTTVTFVALLFWSWILGALGALLAIPLTLLAKTLLVDIDPRAGWADALLRAQRAPGPGQGRPPEGRSVPDGGPAP